MADMYQIVNAILEQDLPDGATGFVPTWAVTYLVTKGPASGTRGQVKIPADRYNAETVKATIDSAVMHHDQVFRI